MKTLLIGSNNTHKVEEFRFIVEAQNIAHILIPSTVPNFPTDIPETGSTLEENAYIKASTIFHATGMNCVSDDTGLEVDALDGAPGVYSARYAGEHASYADNRGKLLDALKNVSPNQRTARFRTVICYHDNLRVLFAEGICEGTITLVERGDAGFGYDSIFQPNDHEQTFAELAPEEKHRISHRGKALENLAALLRTLE